MTRKRLWILLIFVFYAITATLYIVSVPIFEASDEAEHFIHIHTILETGDLPVIQSRDEMANQTDPILRWNNQSHHAPLYYMMSSALISWSERGDLPDYLQPNEMIFLRNTVEDNPNKWLHRYTPPTSDTHIAVLVLRVVNMLIGASTLWMVYCAGRELTDHKFIPVLAMLFTASIPTFVVVNTSVTNDALVIFLYSAGIVWTLKHWNSQKATIADLVLLALILGGIALTKLTGVTLYSVVFVSLVAGVMRDKWTWQYALKLMVVMGLSGALFAGWWYLRNLALYGDLLAVDATASIWGRETPLSLAVLPDELLRIGKSFWMLIGYLHYPVFAPDGFYIYALIITLIGTGGLIRFATKNNTNDKLYLLLFACFVVTAMLLYGTLSVDISYGRLLLPAMAGFAPLIALGLWQVFRQFTVIFVLPFMLTAVVVPIVVVPMAYPTLNTVETIPDGAIPVMWQADNLDILAIDAPHGVVNGGDSIVVDLYFSGNHPTNPAMTITAVDTIQAQRFDHIEVYPGMADMRVLPDDNIFVASFRLNLPQPEIALPPRMVTILVEWIDLDTNEALMFDSGLSLLEIPSVTFVDSAYVPPEFENTLDVNFADEIRLINYRVPDRISAGETMPLSFVWESTLGLARDNEAILTIKLFSIDDALITQDDGTMWWYPTTVWAEGVPFEDARSLDIPSDLPAGQYELRVGWYRVVDEMFPRLPITNADNIDNLYVIPLEVTEE